MSIRIALISTVSFLTLVGCHTIIAPVPTPTLLPGWQSLVSDLLLEDDALPEGWSRIRNHPRGSLTDSTINHVYRSWWNEAEGSSGKVQQHIWRAYSIVDAKEKYAELRQSPVLLSRFTPSPYDFYVEFCTPPEIGFQSQVADEFYLVCGWRGVAYCEVVARYRNYVIDMRLAREAECEGHVTHGLTYPEIETVVRAMDARFEQFFAGLSMPGP